MKEEEVDQYFKDKFQQFAPVPSADAWARLQSKMEPPQQKRSLMWVYSVAATITLLLVSGVLFFWLPTDKIQPDGNLTRTNPISGPQPLKLTPKETTLADINAKTPSWPETVETITREKVSETNNANASTNTTTSKPAKKGKKIRPGVLVASTKTKNRENLKSRKEPNSSPETLPVNTVVAQTTPDAPATTEERVMEVIIKKDPVPTVAYTSEKEYATTEEVIKENISKKGRLVKNIFKQVRNLKNGEKVELSDLGVNANYRIDVESKLFKQKYTKVINL
ncbi:hypothetical protein AHMF7605_28155 [Adhaeribacter arboris]|uniref:Uncharacterized protein n=1 Tax=Adhaeribacter arboris TaxID=2072846 RepID=A0A2T2YNJ3_9BACT|nr:hypothetical protein [Adhaeribacter arboris]PSR57077.1 hypothetical protein AHMF7605_28155 [Adhaeribacter arboris]